jgi:hypothetical protein
MPFSSLGVRLDGQNGRKKGLFVMPKACELIKNPVEVDRRFFGIASIISLALGMGIYLFFRNTNMMLFEWVPKLQFFNDIYIPTRQNIFTSLFLYNVPDALWFLSGILFFRFLWFHHKKWQGIYILCFYGIAVTFEICQLSDYFPGTFDWLDLFSFGITAFIEGLLYKNLILRSLK